MAATRFDAEALEELRETLAQFEKRLSSERATFARYGSVGKGLDEDWQAMMERDSAVRRDLSLKGTDRDKRRFETEAAVEALTLSFKKWMTEIERSFNRRRKA
jgi:hypothetical protein